MINLICAIFFVFVLFLFLKTHMTTSIAMRVCTVQQALHTDRIKFLRSLNEHSETRDTEGVFLFFIIIIII